jgi:hypothetical protein
MSIQQTLSGDETDCERERPRTFLWCETCEDVVLRSREFDHRHDLVELGELADDEDAEENEPERIGGLYRIELSYSVDYVFHVPAWSEWEAKEIAEEWACDATAADRFLMHTDKTEMKEIMSDDAKIPDDFDPCGDTLLHEVYGDD